MNTANQHDVYDELETLTAQVDTLHRALTDLTNVVQQLTGTPKSEAGTTPRLVFPDVESFVSGMFLPMFGWRIDGQRSHWCPRWWDHAEAIWRLETLWRSWEAHRLIATGMSSWSAELDRQLPHLLGTDGPMASCRAASHGLPARHEPGHTPTTDPTPPGWWNP